MEKHTVSRLIGAPPGYVGYDQGGLLTEAVSKNPHAVLLLDEIEKAHPEVFNILLQVLDNGRLTDAKGRVVNFKNTIIILTSNIGAEYIDRMEKLGFSEGSEKKSYEASKDKVMNALKDHFRPEFLNRLDDIIIFDVLTQEAVRKIVDIQIDLVKARLAEKDIRLDVSPAVLEFLAKDGYNPQYGARPIRRLIQTKILTPVASLMISQEVMRGGTVAVGLKTGKDVPAGEFTFEVKKGRKGSPITMDSVNFGLKKGQEVE